MGQVFVIAGKELLEIFRDKTTWIVLLIAFTVFPVYNYGINEFMSEANETETLYVTVGDEETFGLLKEYAETQKIKVEIRNYDEISADKADFSVVVEKNGFYLVCKSNSFKSVSGATKFGDLFGRYLSENSVYADKIVKINLLDSSGKPVVLNSVMKKLAIPAVLILTLFQGTTGFVSDAFAGEKERKTLEMLIYSGADRRCIYLGKMLAHLFLAAVNSVIVLLSCLITKLLSGGNEEVLLPQNSGASAVAVILLLLIIMCVFSVIISLSVSLRSRSVKQAQIINEILILFPTSMTIALSFELIRLDGDLIRFIPLINVIENLILTFSGEMNIGNIFLSVFISGLFLVLTAAFDFRYLKGEKLIPDNG